MIVIASFKDAFPKLTFGFHIQRAGEVVEDDEFRFADEHARGGGALCLSAREFDAACADHGFEIVIELFEVAIHHGEFCSFVDFVVAFVQAEQNVVPQGVAEQARDLRGVGTARRDEEIPGEVSMVSPFQRISPESSGEQSEQCAQEGCFARTNAACDNCQRAAFDVELKCLRCRWLNQGSERSDGQRPAHSVGLRRFLSGRSHRAAAPSKSILGCVRRARSAARFPSDDTCVDGDIELFVTRPSMPAEGGEIAHALQEINEERKIAEGEVARAHGLTDEHENDARAERGRVAIERAEHFVE
jgi:hypothetical protein